MPRRLHDPTEEEKEKYGLEAYIERKVTLMHMCEMEYDFLRKDPKSSKEAAKEADKILEDESNHPYDPELTKKYVEKCEKIVAQPATTAVERTVKGNAAFVLSSRMTGTEFPEHVEFYILREYTKRLDELLEHEDSDSNSSAEEGREYMKRVAEQQRIRKENIPGAALNLKPDAKILIDESLAESLLNDFDQLGKATFVMRDSYGEEELLEDATKFRITAWGKSSIDPNPFWEIVYDHDDYDFPTKIDREEMKYLLLSSAMYKD